MMIDLTNIGKYTENNRIEAKKALGGLPHSIGETYSAFANTLGGILLLGVEEHTDKSLHPIDLPNPEKLIKEFWDIINNPKKVSVNILSHKDVYVQEVQGKRMVVINVPRAQRFDRPVYLEGNSANTYRRNGEGDYKCTKEEVNAMLRDAAVRTQDMLIIEEMGLDVFCYDSIRRYRVRMRNYRPGHVWDELEDVEFLYKLGAIGRSDDGKLHPTAAGLLMFGYEYEIVKEYPYYFLDYQEQMDAESRWTDRIVSSSGEWSGNIYDFYFRVYNKITQDIKVPFVMEGGNRIDDTPVHKALREALANCLINADYYGRQGVVITKRKDSFTFSNPGGFRIDLDAAKIGGISDPRNASLIKMFSLVEIGERAGSGIPNIYNVWKKQGWVPPIIDESFEPERITLSLFIEKNGDKKMAIECGDKKVSAKTALHKAAIIAYLTEHVEAKNNDISELLGLKPSRVRAILGEMVEEGFIVAEGGNKKRIYKLKS
ncbi:MAG: putative DNA binding domain-containing protein [Lachnospiraceae bacterium]|nr:putative DNA binding domain-containing protein [Lachnospiraceae bacterium]